MSKTNSTEFIITPTFRLAFEALFKPARSLDPAKPGKYGATMLFPKEGCDITELKKLAMAAIEAKWGADKSKWPKGLHNPIQDGDEHPEWTGFEGCWYVRAVSNYAPAVVDQTLKPVEALEGNEKVYSGCYCRAQVNAFAWENTGKKGVSFGISAIQKVKDGERFGGRVDASKVFDKVASSKDDPKNYAPAGAEAFDPFA